MLHEVVGDTFDVVKVSLIEGEHKSAAFSLINRNHCVPVLEVTWDNGGSQRILESAAMVAFLADAYLEKHLAPPPGASRCRSPRWKSRPGWSQKDADPAADNDSAAAPRAEYPAKRDRDQIGPAFLMLP